MSKLPEEYKFLDLSDYGRFIARRMASSLTNTKATPIHVTTWFIVAGLLAMVCILYSFNIAAAVFLILKSILDAADGELSRMKNMPSYVGRYYDSIADILLNFMILLTLGYVHDTPILYIILAFIGIQLQGTLYNYYYVILRNSVNGDTTSRVFEDKAPVAMQDENQKTVDLFYTIFNTLYVAFDKTIYYIDPQAVNSKPFPKWFMTCVSLLGLGFQLLIMSIFLVLNLDEYIIPFFIFYTVLIFIFVVLRRVVLE